MIMRPRINLIPGTARVTPSLGNLFTPTGTYVLPNGVDDTEALQAAIDSLYRNQTTGIGGLKSYGGTVKLVPGIYYISSTVWMYSGVILEGAGVDATIIQLKSGSNCTMFKSGGDPDLRATEDPRDFDHLVDGNYWIGIPNGIGFKHLCLDQNRVGQTAGSCVQLYGKKLYARNLALINAYEYGWYSKGGNQVGQADYHDMPEADIEKIFIKNCLGTCFHFEGPHDSYIKDLGIAAGNAQKGVYIGGNGNCYAGMIHEYACSGPIGFHIGAGLIIRADCLVAESNHGVGFLFDGDHCQIQSIEAYKNCRSLFLTDLVDTTNFAWVLSGSGTNEYYLTTAPNGTKSLPIPPLPNWVYINGAVATKGTLGSLAAGTWGYGDNNTLGYNTVYVRLSDGADPDSKATGFVQVADYNISVDIRGSNSNFGNLLLRRFAADSCQEQIGIRISGNGHNIGAIQLNSYEDGVPTNCKIGLDIDSKLGRNLIAGGEILGCAGGDASNRSYGLVTGRNYKLLKSQINLHLQGNDVNWHNPQTGERNIINIISSSAAETETMFMGQGPDKTYQSEIWNYVGYDAGANVWRYSGFRRVGASDIDMTSTAVQTKIITLPILGASLNIEDVQLTFYAANAGTSFRWDIPPFVKTVSGGDVTVVCKLGTAGTNTGKIVLWANI